MRTRVDRRERYRAKEYSGLKGGERFFLIGNPELLHEPLLGLISSRACPGSVLLETLDRVPRWLNEERIILSGFHAPLEEQVLHSILRRKGRVIKFLARGVTDYRVPAGEREALDQGRLLVLTACPPEVHRTTRATALKRNRLVLSLPRRR